MYKQVFAGGRFHGEKSATVVQAKYLWMKELPLEGRAL